jgi:hypothetical protein
MMVVIKRYAMAFFFLLLVSVLMVLGTWGVRSFGEKMFEDTGIEMKPRGENLTK